MCSQSKLRCTDSTDLITHKDKLIIDCIHEIRASKETQDVENRISVTRVQRSLHKGIIMRLTCMVA